MSDLPRGWAQTTLGAVCEVVSGATPKTGVPANWGGDIPWVTPDDLSKNRSQLVGRGARFLTRSGHESCSARLLPPGAVLYSSRAPIGYAAIAANAVATNQGFKSLIPPRGLLSKYLYWYMSFITPEVRRRASGTTFLEISKAAISEVPLCIPPTAEQYRIVAAIEEEFSRIDAAAAALDSGQIRLKMMRAALLGAAIGGQLIDSERPLQSQADGRPAIPTAWRWVTVRDVAEVQGGITKNPQRAPRKTTAPFLRVANVGRGTFSLDDMHLIEVAPGEIARFGLKDGDLLVVEGNGSPDQIGRSAVWRGHISGCVHQNHLIRVRPGPEINPEYLGLYWNAPWPSQQIAALASSTSGLHTLSVGKVARVPLALPPIAEQADIVAHVREQEARMGRITAHAAQSRVRAATLRSAILGAAFTGRLVHHEPGDEPASVLLKHIARERTSVDAQAKNGSRSFSKVIG